MQSKNLRINPLLKSKKKRGICSKELIERIQCRLLKSEQRMVALFTWTKSKLRLGTSNSVVTPKL